MPRRVPPIRSTPVRRTEELSRFGSKGGKAAAAGMTAAERKARAKKAIAARWGKARAKRTEGK
jgi:hypothetical protein